MLTITKHYDALIAEQKIIDDPEQRHILEYLEHLSEEINNESWFKLSKQHKSIYIYGPVGRGKSYLIDLFFQSIKKSQKKRMHFHALMQNVDNELRLKQGKKNPLSIIATSLAKKIHILCLDEFLIHDIADAMIIAKLLPELLNQGMILIITANTKPQDLYLNGLQRSQFLPVINVIKQNFHILELKGQRDYRLQKTKLLKTFIWPLDKANQELLQQEFNQLANNVLPDKDILIQSRLIPVLQLSEHVIWFDFDAICNVGRSQLDYLEIAELFDAVFISGLTVLTHNPAKAILFINFIDIMYDKKVRVVIGSNVPIEAIYTEGKFIEIFQRTLSRLHEMQSADYLVN